MNRFPSGLISRWLNQCLAPFEYPPGYGIRAASATLTSSVRFPVARSTFQMPTSSGINTFAFGSGTPAYPYPGRTSFSRRKSHVMPHFPSGLSV